MRAACSAAYTDTTLALSRDYETSNSPDPQDGRAEVSCPAFKRAESAESAESADSSHEPACQPACQPAHQPKEKCQPNGAALTMYRSTMEILFSQRHVGEMCCALRHWYVNFPRFHGFRGGQHPKEFRGASLECDETGVTAMQRSATGPQRRSALCVSKC